MVDGTSKDSCRNELLTKKALALSLAASRVPPDGKRV